MAAQIIPLHKPSGNASPEWETIEIDIRKVLSNEWCTNHIPQIRAAVHILTLRRAEFFNLPIKKRPEILDELLENIDDVAEDLHTLSEMCRTAHARLSLMAAGAAPAA